MPVDYGMEPERGGQLQMILRNFRGCCVFAALTANTIFWCLPLFVLAIAKLAVPPDNMRRTITRMLMTLGENWVSGNAMILRLRDREQLSVRSEVDLKRDGWYLVVSNHLSWVDIVVLQTAFNRRIPFLKFFIKQELIWFPVLGIAWWALDMPFMKRYSKSYLARHPEKRGLDFEATRAACKKFTETPTSVINFVEGTRFNPEKKAKRASPYDNLLPPRAGGIALALSSMGAMFDAILDVTIVYPEGVTQFWDLCCGGLKKVIVDVRRRPVETWMLQGDYGSDREYRGEFHRWLTSLWQDKDRRINELRTDGLCIDASPASPDRDRRHETTAD